MYESFYNLREKPFSIVSDPSMLYLSAHHQRALTYLEYGLMENTGFILLTGDIGTGKTTLVRYALKNLISDMEVAVVFNTSLSEREFINYVLRSFDIQTSGESKSESIELFKHFLIEKHAEERKVLLIIDEAQNLSDGILEEVRMLSNIQNDYDLLLQVMLVGQPELKERLKQRVHMSLSQRIAVNFYLGPLSKNEVQAYISFRLEKVGGKPDLFSPDAVDLIYRTSSGIPRTINLMCDAALVYGFGYDLDPIDISVIEQVIKDKDGLGVSTTVEAGTDMPLTPQKGQTDLDFQNRLNTLESSVRDLQVKMEWYAEQSMQPSRAIDNQQFHKLKKLIVTERHRCDLLKTENLKLRKRMEDIEIAWKEDIEALEKIASQKDARSGLKEWLKEMKMPG